MTEGSGISDGTGTIYKASVVKTVMDGITHFYTRIYIDLTGLDSVATANDIIGTGASAAHLGQVTAANNGTIYAGSMTCLETPAGGDNDIDLSNASVATGVLGADVTGLTNYAQLINAGDATLGATDVFTAWPTADYYLYLAAGTGDTAATYTAGKFLIEMHGYADN